MASSFICPHCGKAVTVTKVPVDTCPHCGGEIPEELALELERQFQPVRPLSLSFQLWLGFVFGFFMLVMLPGAFQPVDDSVYTMLGIPPPPHLPPIVTGIVKSFETVFLLWSSYSLYRHEFRSRSLLMLTVFLFTVPETALAAPIYAGYPMGKFIFVATALISLLTLLFAYWYLYMWKYSVAYYESLYYIDGLKKMK